MTRILIFLFIILFSLVNVAIAETITMTFSGTVTSTEANAVNISEARPGDVVTGSFSYDSEVTDEMPSNSFSGLYSADALDLEINGYRYSLTDNNIAIVNDAVVFPGSPIVDVFEIVSPLRDVSGPDLSGLPIAQIDITLVDSTNFIFRYQC
jgi:hypothetical protein